MTIQASQNSKSAEQPQDLSSRRQFTLPSVLMFPFLISPLFLGGWLARWQVDHDPADFTPLFNAMVCTVIYAVVFARRRGVRDPRRSLERQFRPLLPCVWTGIRYGWLFATIALLPLFVGVGGGRGTLVRAFLRNGVTPHLVGEAIFVFGFVGCLGVSLGAFGGALAGFLVEFQRQIRPRGRP